MANTIYTPQINLSGIIMQVQHKLTKTKWNYL